MFNRQELFEKIVTNLWNQNCKSESIVGCAYRGDNGTKCAIGFIIDDSDYNIAFEETNPSLDGLDFDSDKIITDEASEISQYLVKKGFIEKEHDVNFWLDMQWYCHDSIEVDNDKNSFRQGLIEGAKKIATRFNLDDRFIKELPR